MEEKLTDQELARRAKLPKYKELGVDPFGTRYEWKDQIRDIRAKYGELSAEELTEKNIGSDISDIVSMESEKTFSSIGHILRLGGNTDGETARHVNTDVLLRKGVGKIALNGNGSEIKEGIALENRPNERGAAVDTACR